MAAIKKRIFICIVIGIVAVVAIIGAIVLSSSNSEITPAEFLSLGEKYLAELDYEQALVQFLKVIEIEPMNERAYLGAAEAYLGLGRQEEAIAVLERGLVALPDNEYLRSMLEELQDRAVDDTESGTENSEPVEAIPDVQIWESFTDEQRALLENLERAIETFDHETAYDIATSDAYLGLFSERDIDREGGFLFYQTNGNYRYRLNYWDDDDEKDYWWRREEEGIETIECQLWLTDSAPQIAIRHMSVDAERRENGAYEMLVFCPDATLTRYEGNAVDRLRHGAETKTDLLTGDQWVFQFEMGYCINYQTQPAELGGQAYVLSDHGREDTVPIDHALQANTIH